MSKVDELTVFLGKIDDAEHEQRRRILVCRNAASYRVTRTTSAAARSFLWTLSECANGYVFAPVDIETLTKVSTFCRRLLMMADMAEELMDDGDDREIR